MKNKMKFGFVAVAATLLVYVGCKKDKEEDDRDGTTAVEYAMADASFGDVASIADEGYDGSLESYRVMNGGPAEKVMTSCATITFDTTSLPKTFTIDFGTVDCKCVDDIYRRGKIIVSWVNPYRDSGSTHTISFDNYFVNYNQLLGTKTVTNNGRNSAGKLSFTVAINGSIIWDPQYFGGGGTSTYNSTRTRVWTAGEATPSWLDDVYHISGTASGTTRTGSSYTMSTTTPLKKEIGYKHLTDGILVFTPSGKYPRTIDYGYVNGLRDALAKVTINGYTFTIQLK